GQKLNLVGGATGSTQLTFGNIGVVADGDSTLEIKLAQNIDLGDDGSVTMGNTTVNNDGMTVDDGSGNSTIITTGGVTVSSAGGHSTSYDASGMTIQGGPSVTMNGIDAGGQRITNVAPGVNNSDAATVGQLQNMQNLTKNYTDQRFRELKNDMGHLSDRM